MKIVGCGFYAPACSADGTLTGICSSRARAGQEAAGYSFASWIGDSGHCRRPGACGLRWRWRRWRWRWRHQSSCHDILHRRIRHPDSPQRSSFRITVVTTSLSLRRRYVHLLDPARLGSCLQRHRHDAALWADLHGGERHRHGERECHQRCGLVRQLELERDDRWNGRGSHRDGTRVAGQRRRQSQRRPERCLPHSRPRWRAAPTMRSPCTHPAGRSNLHGDRRHGYDGQLQRDQRGSQLQHRDGGSRKVRVHGKLWRRNDLRLHDRSEAAAR